MNNQLRHGAGDDTYGVADGQLVIPGIGKADADGDQTGSLCGTEMSIVLQRHTVLEPPAGECRRASDGDIAEGETNRITRELNLRLRYQRPSGRFGTADGRRIRPGIAKNVRAGRHIRSCSDARRSAREINAIHKKLGGVRKITASAYGRRCAAVRKPQRVAAIIATTVKIDDAIRSANRVGTRLIESSIGITDHGAIV